MTRLLALALLLPFLVQDPAGQEPLPDGVVARLGDREIPLEDYKTYLYQRFGKRALSDYVLDLALADEAKRYGIEVSEAEVQAKVEERLASLRASSRTGDVEADLQRNGQDLELFRLSTGMEMRRDLLLNALIMETRVATDEIVNREFERLYGPGGEKLRIRHVLVMPNVLRAEAVRAGTKPTDIDMDQMKAQARSKAEEAKRRIAAGEDFAVVAADLSHDKTTNTSGGELANYNGRLYGPGFRDAVTALDTGQVSGVVETGAGFHVIEVVERSKTDLASVRTAVIEAFLASEPSWQEKSTLMQSIQGSVDMQLW